ncbi:MAG: hypothetical protein FWB73_02485, partial [Treponema sp.]|nr:hypothetical protein [Treponema sp.]
GGGDSNFQNLPLKKILLYRRKYLSLRKSYNFLGEKVKGKHGGYRSIEEQINLLLRSKILIEILQEEQK